MNWLTTPPLIHPPPPPITATCSWDKDKPDSGSGGGVAVEGPMSWGGEGQWWRKYLVSSLLVCLIGRYWKMSFVLGPRPARGTEDPPHWRAISGDHLQVWAALLNPVVGMLLIITGPSFSCDNRPWLQLWWCFVKKDAIFWRKSGLMSIEKLLVGGF